ncbi:hypothetical protein M231_04966 [Tremella mesenterica]|uniref:Uncharacterized protein n=1 Tax=Tremella mesenterica TaxID=5217 RepID=A0A4V1M3Q8_TREME|nr:hypothetical protein M231_04966 [Tremella mesenterica]
MDLSFLTALLPPLPRLPTLPKIQFPSIKEYIPFRAQVTEICRWYEIGAESAMAWATSGKDQVFGPLEQVVAVAVLIGLGLRYDPSVFYSPTVVSFQSPQEQNPRNVRTEQASSVDDSSLETSPSTGTQSGQGLVDLIIAFYARDWTGALEALQGLFSIRSGSIDVMTILMVGMIVVMAIMLLPDHFKRRCKNAWEVFRRPDDTPENGQNRNTA